MNLPMAPAGQRIEPLYKVRLIVERDGRESLFHRLDEASLHDWLEDYSLSELWEKNVIGGRPA